MPSKYQEYRQMADTAERQLTSSYKSWTQFLRTAARLYKYPYNEQVMIHAQRPDATACVLATLKSTTKNRTGGKIEE